MNSIVIMPSPFAHRAEFSRNGALLLLPAAEDGDPERLMATARSCGEDVFSSGLDFLAIHAPFGGDAFSGPVRVDANTAAILQKLSSEAPVHVPATLAAVHAAQKEFPETPTVLVSETAFFTRLPRRERAYGLSPGLMQQLRLRRTGYHGIFHEAAFAHARRTLRPARSRNPLRVLSICLDPKPEIAAISNNRPLMVTGGATPLEGLPGETSCGEIDASLPLALLEKAGLGPQEIGHMLARESGMRGLTGCAMTFLDVFGSETPESAAAQEIFRYRLLLACGAGLAALSGLDGIVFSGRYAQLSAKIGPWLRERLHRAMRDAGPPPPWIVFDECLAKLVADQALHILRPALV